MKTKAMNLFRNQIFIPIAALLLLAIFNLICDPSFYQITFEGKTYIYVDFIEEKTLEIPVHGIVSVYEKSDDVSYAVSEGAVSVSGTNGYAVFIAE